MFPGAPVSDIVRWIAVALLLSATALPATPRTRAVRPPIDRILWIGAHPDDETLIAPLLGRECVERGARCAMLVLTQGEAAGPGATRAAEMQAAANMLHAHLTLWTFSDVMSDAEAVWSGEAGGREALLDRIAAVIVAEAPTAIYTFDPTHGSTCHPAHRALGRLVVEAVSRILAPPLFLVETAATFEWSGFTFRSAVAQPVTIDATAEWSYLVRDAQLHASQFSSAQIESLANTPSEQRRVYLIDARDASSAMYSFTCP